MNLKFRPDIEGLRAVSVVAVLLFHALPQLMPGGFLGVDLFFVLSGFLITSIVSSKLGKREFRYGEYLLARIFRLMPALLVIVGITLIGSYFLHDPKMALDTSTSSLSVVSYVSNFFFWMTSGYFDGAAHLKPLLHTWSLAVEVQYYILLPLILIIIRYFERHISYHIIYLGLIFLSLLLSISVFSEYPMTVFYMMPFRLWEFLVGGYVATLRTHFSASMLPMIFRSESTFNPSAILAYVGFTLLSVTLYTGSSQNYYSNIMVVFGIAMYLTFATNYFSLSKALSIRPVVFIGSISYSIYLCHQPVFSFFRYIYSGHIDIGSFIFLTLVTFFLSIAMFKFVEQPFRRLDSSNRRYKLTILTLVILFLSGSAFYSLHVNGFEQRKLEGQTLVAYRGVTKSIFRDSCHTSGQHYLSPSISCFQKEMSSSVAVVGDSHGVEISAAMYENRERSDLDVRQFTFSSCVPNISDLDNICSPWLRDVIAEIASDDSIKSIVLAFRLNSILFGDHSISYPGPVDTVGIEERKFRWAGIIELTEALSKLDKDIYFLIQVPELPKNVHALLFNAKGSSYLSSGVLREWYDYRSLWVYKNIDDISKFSTVIDSTDLFCDKKRCRLGDQKGVYYFDDHHLSMHGARKVSERIFSLIKKE